MTEISEQAIAVPVSDLRKLCRLPDEVIIICVLPNPSGHSGTYQPEWYAPGGRDREMLYLRVHSKYAVRCPAGCVLTIEPLEEFLERYRSLRDKQRQVVSTFPQSETGTTSYLGTRLPWPMT